MSANADATWVFGHVAAPARIDSNDADFASNHDTGETEPRMRELRSHARFASGAEGDWLESWRLRTLADKSYGANLYSADRTENDQPFVLPCK